MLGAHDIRLVVRVTSAERTSSTDLTITLSPGACGADLRRALTPAIPLFGGARLALFDSVGLIPDDALVAERVSDGDEIVVSTSRPADPTTAARADPTGMHQPHLVITGGLEVGDRLALADRVLSLGRDRSCDLRTCDATVSGRHALVSLVAGDRHSCDEQSDSQVLRVVDQGSVNGTYVNERSVRSFAFVASGDVIRLGAVELELRLVEPRDRPIGMVVSGRERGQVASPLTAFNRPPRTRAGHKNVVIDPPKPPPIVVGKAPFRPAAIVVPLVFAGLLVAVTKQWMFALFAGMSPVMMTMNSISDRRSNRDRSRRERARFHGELAAFDGQLAAVALQERERRRAGLPDLAEIERRAALPSRRLWERRPQHDDFLCLRIGTGDPTWDPPLHSPISPGDAALAAVLDRHTRLRSTPIGVDLRPGRVVGIAGPRRAVDPLVRALVAQIAVLHGPADVQVAFALDPDRVRTWDWAKWLPHVDTTAPQPGIVALGAAAFEHLAAALVSAAPLAGGEPAAITTVVLVDAAASTLHDAPALRRLLGDRDRPISAIVVAASVDELPAICTTVVRMAASEGSDVPTAVARIEDPGTGRAIDELLVNGITARRARAIARSLARFNDPDRADAAAAGIASDVSLLALLDVDAGTTEAELGRTLAARWSKRSPDAAPTTVIGLSERGRQVIDIVRDGPHALIGGTTGSGKSELLRSFVVGLAAVSSPEQLTFVLIDYKGGSAFDACARLPHVVGVVTDLDELLSARAVRCLEAELRWRERLLREAGVSDRDSYARLVQSGGPSPFLLPRLVLVVDEFATLKAELPAFVDALVDVAQRGRSLGVHLVLATQRPAGTVSDLIRANTELKIALRVQDRADSMDVIGSPLAALLPRSRSGMAVVRIGSEEPVTIQAAYTGRPAEDVVKRLVRIRPFTLLNASRPRGVPPRKRALAADGDTELTRIVGSACAAAAILGYQTPRRPWPDPLPAQLDLRSIEELLESPSAGDDDPTDVCAAAPAVGIIDDPDHQRRRPLVWEPARGNLLLVGVSGVDTGAALATIAAAFTGGPQSAVHIYGVHAGPSPLEAIRVLPHCGDVIPLADRERVDRLVRELAAEVQRRQAMPAAERPGQPRVIVLIDGLGLVRTELDDPTVTNNAWVRLQRILADGPNVDVVCALTIDRPALITGPVGALAEQRWVFRLADRIDYSLFGVRGADVAPMPRLRCLVVSSGLYAQVADPPSVDEMANIGGPSGRVPKDPPRRIRVLPEEVRVDDLDHSATTFGDRPWRVAVGLADATLSTAVASFHSGEHLLVCGPARCGRTTTLAAIAHSTMRTYEGSGHGPVIAYLAASRSRLPTLLAGCAEVVALADIGDVTHLRPGAAGRPMVLLFDDAELLDDPSGAMAALGTGDQPDLLIVAAVRTELLRSNYSHWTRQLRRSRSAILLRPSDGDAEFTGISIPRRGVPVTAGRGLLAQDGQLDVIQFATP